MCTVSPVFMYRKIQKHMHHSFVQQMFIGCILSAREWAEKIKSAFVALTLSSREMNSKHNQ